MKHYIRKLGISLVMAMAVVLPTWADDVEIFFNVNDPESATPLVMFSLDYRPNLNSTICNLALCPWYDYWVSGDTTGLDENMQLMGDLLITPNYAGDADIDFIDDTSVNFIELLRASLRVVLNNVRGIKVGLMLNHNNASTNSCQYPDDGTDINGVDGPNGVNNDDGSDKDCSNGGYINLGFTEVNGATVSATAGDDMLLARLERLPVIGSGNNGHPYQGKELYYEFYRYLMGYPVFNGYSGRNDYKDTCDADNLPNQDSDSCSPKDEDVEPELTWDTSIIANTNTLDTSDDEYISPLAAASECTGLFAVNFMMGVSNQEAESNDYMTDVSISSFTMTATDEKGDVDTLVLPNSENAGFPTVIEWMHNAPDGDLRDFAPAVNGAQYLKSYFVYKPPVQQNTLTGYAVAGGSDTAIAASEDASELISQISSIFDEIKRQNSTFESPAVTVNSYTRLTHREELFYALFEPNTSPDWPGNLKKYKLKEVWYDTDSDNINDTYGLRIVGQNDAAAIDNVENLFKASACSFWTDCDIDRDGDNIDDPDGDIVHWGGMAEELGTGRDVYTDIGASPETVISSAGYVVNEANVSESDLGIPPLGTAYDADLDIHPATADGVYNQDDIDAWHTRLIKLAQGLDPETDDALNTMGDPIHARPAVIEYDADIAGGGANPELAIAISTNEGYFHLINAMSITQDGVEGGGEYFAYIPSDLLPLVGQVNEAAFYNADVGPAGDGPEGTNRYKTYGLDGSPVVWHNDANADGDIEVADGDHVYVYLTQRRGGRNIYALDITDRQNPKFKWKIEGGTGDFTRLGQTWSEPQLATIKKSGVDTEVLVLGGGYDDIELNPTDMDHDDGYYLADGAGDAIYVLNAETGALEFYIHNDTSNSNTTLDIDDMTNGIPANVRVLDIDQDGYMDRIYAVDVVGRVFRVDFDNLNATTTIYDGSNNGGGGVVAFLNKDEYGLTCDTGTPAEVAEADRHCQRRFFNAPDIAVMVGYPVSPYVQIGIGSGYRPHPVSSTGIQDRYYMLFDDHVTDGVDSDDYDTEYEWTEGDLYDISVVNGTLTLGELETDISDKLSNTDPADGPVYHGWYMNMDMSKKEKVLSESVTLQGKTIFSTYLRDASLVSNCDVDLGQGRVYVVDSFTGLPVADFNGTGNLLTGDDTTSSDDRYKSLDRTGIPSDPLIVFRENSDGEIEPVVVVTSELPLNEEGQDNILGTNLNNRTWWIDVE
ncbi:pilus assembly protein [Pseudomonadota bacterium]